MNWRQWRVGASVSRARIASELTPYGGIVLLLALLFAILAYVVHCGDATAFDRAVHHALRPDDDAPGASGVLWLGPEVGAASIAIVALLALWQAWRRHWLAAATLLASMGGVFALTRVLKVIIGRSRAGEIIGIEPVGLSDFLFPSTHTVLTVVGYGLLAWYVALLAPRWRALIWGAYAIVLAFVGFSLVYLDTHYCTDVGGGLLVGGGWLIVCVRLLAALGAAGDGEAEKTPDPSYAGSLDRYVKSDRDLTSAPRGERG